MVFNQRLVFLKSLWFDHRLSRLELIHLSIKSVLLVCVGFIVSPLAYPLMWLSFGISYFLVNRMASLLLLIISIVPLSLMIQHVHSEWLLWVILIGNYILSRKWPNWSVQSLVLAVFSTSFFYVFPASQSLVMTQTLTGLGLCVIFVGVQICFLENKQLTLINSLEGLITTIFNLCITQNYQDNKVYHEYTLHQKTRIVWQSLSHYKTYSYLFQTAESTLFYQLIESYYIIAMRLSTLLHRMHDHSTFGLFHKELYGLQSAFQLFFTHLKAGKTDDTFRLSEEIKELVIIEDKVLQVVTLDNYIMLIFINDLMLLNALNGQLQQTYRRSR
jgi:hypothetical protein